MMEGAPTKLSPRHRLLALMIAAGHTNRDIATTLGYSESRISVIRSSPFFQALVEDCVGDIRNRGAQSVVEEIILEGRASVRRLRELRDQGDELAVARAAADSLLDRNPQTAKHSHREENREIRVTWGPETLAAMQSGMKEIAVATGAQNVNFSRPGDGAIVEIDATPPHRNGEPVSGGGPGGGGAVRLLSLDEAVEEVRRANGGHN
jgi:hypothetical protein